MASSATLRARGRRRTGELYAVPPQGACQNSVNDLGLPSKHERSTGANKGGKSMATAYKEVEVVFNGGKPQCKPEWVELFWTKPGEDNIRWTFVDFPQDVVNVVVEFMSFLPSKYRPAPGKPPVPGFLARSPFRGVGAESQPGGLPRLYTFGNRQDQGYFCYTLRFFDAAGKELYCCDPGGVNDPDPPSGQHP